jgi:hypothetical protein
VQQGGHFLDDHPEYEMRGHKGNRIGRFCYNSGYLDVMKEIVAEQLAYGIAGFDIDMVDQGFGPPYGCWCKHCQKMFNDKYGTNMPQGATWDEAWDRMLEFRYTTSERFEKALYKYIKKLNPEATVDYNYHGNPPFSFEVGQRPVQHAGNVDFVTGETGVWGFSALTVGLNAELYRASTPGVPFEVAMQRGVRMYHDQTTPPQNRPFILPGLIEDAPMYRVRLDLAEQIKHAECMNPTTRLKRMDRHIEAVVEDIHEVVIVK